MRAPPETESPRPAEKGARGSAKSSTRPTTTGEQAWAKLREWGFAPIPLKPRDKTPLIEWAVFQDRQPKNAEIAEWLHRWPDCNVGVVTGAISGILVLDVDGDQGKAQLARLGDVPRTPTVRTGNGRHIYFRHPGGTVRNFARKCPGLDLRGDGGYVVAASSVHPSGARYEWEISPDDTPLANPPQWLLDLIRSSPRRDANGKDDDPIPEGTRNQALTKLAGAMRRHGIGEATIFFALLGVNGARCQPPLSEDEVRRIATSVARYEPKRSQRDSLIRLTAGAKLWHDADGEGFITFEVNGHGENWRLRSKGAREWFYSRYFDTYDSAPGSQAFEDAMRQLEAEARIRGPEHRAHVRVAEDRGCIYLDLGDPKWRAIEITAEGWRVIKDPPVHFVRTPGMRPLSEPQRDGEIEALRPFLNVQTWDDFRLIVAYLLAALRPCGPYPVLVLNGEQGAAKSTTARVLRALVDPSAVPIRGIPREERDLVAAARNGWVVCFDNLSGIPGWLADTICRLATGGGLGGRQLYTDHDEAVFEAQRPVIINGIPDLATRGDLGDRAVVLTLPQIDAKDRRPETEYWAKFEAAKPRILGALLDGIAHAVRRLPEVDPLRLPRMADFAKWSLAAFPAFGWSEDDFSDAYDMNRAAAVETMIEADPVATAIRKLVEKEAEFDGTPTDLLEKLTGYLEHNERSKYWPKTAAHLGNAVRRAAPGLRAVGIKVETHRTATKRRITLRKVT